MQAVRDEREIHNKQELCELCNELKFMSEKLVGQNLVVTTPQDDMVIRSLDDVLKFYQQMWGGFQHGGILHLVIRVGEEQTPHTD